MGRVPSEPVGQRDPIGSSRLRPHRIPHEHIRFQLPRVLLLRARRSYRQEGDARRVRQQDHSGSRSTHRYTIRLVRAHGSRRPKAIQFQGEGHFGRRSTRLYQRYNFEFKLYYIINNIHLISFSIF